VREVLLSERERDVLAALGRGLSTKEIAAELHIAEGTVRTLLWRAYVGLRVQGAPSERISAVARAKKLGLI
jgi:two-component system, NarL family, response regulator DesR